MASCNVKVLSLALVLQALKRAPAGEESSKYCWLMMPNGPKNRLTLQLRR